MAERAVYYTLHSQLTGLVIFKEKRRTQCRICQKGERGDMSQKNMEVMLSMEDKAEAEELTAFLQSVNITKQTLMDTFLKGVKVGASMSAQKKPA
jgi:hypothetical protein